MKLLVLTAIVAVVTSNPLTENKQWPWKYGHQYQYNVESYTWSKFEQSTSSGSAFKAQFEITVVAPGQLVATLKDPLYAQIQGQISRESLPTDQTYNPVQNINTPFEIYVAEGRMVSLKVPKALSISHENLIKGFISALQVDLSSLNHVDSFPNSYDKETFQGLFKKIETDVTGECETLYSVSPISAEWHRELSVPVEDPFEIIKSRNYESCLKDVSYQFGVPEDQFIRRTSEYRMLVGKPGTIYKAQTFSSVFVNPLLFGKQKAEVHSYVSLNLTSVQELSSVSWKEFSEYRTVESLLFTYNEAAYKKSDKNIADAQKYLQEISTLLQDSSNLPKSDFLSKFNNFVRFLMFMTSEQLTQMTNSIEVAKTPENIVKTNEWIIYRDAVAQAGTLAAYKEIKAWILTKKIEGAEAAEVLSAMSSFLRFPTKEILNEFFDFATSAEIQEQKILNTTALLAATKMISLNNEDLFVQEKVIPRLSQELKLAVEKGDKSKAQVYVRVLGNLAHPSILKVFALYLEGKVPVTKYLRVQMVISLKALANKQNEYVRAVLFSLLKNTAEPYEIRVAAALNIFLAYPSHDMMRIMAYMANLDPSTQVRAVLTNSITFAAGLKDPRFATLAKTAKSVLYMMPKEKFGYRYSTDSLIDDYTDKDNLAHFREVSFIGSENHILPVYQRGALRLRSTGWTEENWFSLSVSDVQYLIDHVTSWYLQSPKKPEDEFDYSAKNVTEMLNIKPKQHSDFEGSFFLDNWNEQMLWTFTKDDLNSLASNYAIRMGGLLTGVEHNYVKLLNQKQVFVTFPLASGMPFMFDYSEPVAFIIKTQSKAKFGYKLFSFKSYDNLDFTYATNLDGSVGFLDTLGDIYAKAGIINKFQFYIPFKLNVALSFGDYKINFKLPQQNVNLLHFSVSPYTSLKKVESLSTVFEDPLTKIIERPAKVFSTDFKFGQLTGTVFEFQGYSYSSDYKDLSKLFDADFLTNVRNLLYQKDVALTEFNLKYLAKESQNNAVSYTVFYDTIYNNQEDPSDDMGPASAMNDVKPNSKSRREEIAKRAAAGIEPAQIRVVDLSATFRGKQKVEYVFTGALANSFADDKVQAALFFNGCEQFNAVFQMIKPDVAPLNFEAALKNKIRVLYEGDIKYGNTDNVHIKGFSERSKDYSEHLLKDPEAKKCLKDISERNFYQMDCYKMIIRAHVPDFFKATVTYKDLSPSALNVTNNAYNIYNQWYGRGEKKDVFKTIKEGKIDIEAQAHYYDNFINYKFTTEYGVIPVYNVEGMSYYPYAMSMYEPITSWERARNWFTGYQNLPYCAVDDNKVWTFSGRSYSYSLTSSWHALMVDKSDEFGNDLVILAKRPSEKQAEVYVSYKTKTGKNLEIKLTPISYEIITVAPKVLSSKRSMYYDDVGKVPLLEYYTIAQDIEVYSINNGAIRIIFDNHRVVVFSDDHRSTTWGLCGRSTTQTSDDYMTPNGLVDLPEHYGASFSLEGGESDPKTVELKKEAKLKAYQPVTKYTNILRSDVEWSKVENESVKGL